MKYITPNLSWLLTSAHASCTVASVQIVADAVASAVLGGRVVTRPLPVMATLGAAGRPGRPGAPVSVHYNEAIPNQNPYIHNIHRSKSVYAT